MRYLLICMPLLLAVVLGSCDNFVVYDALSTVADSGTSSDEGEQTGDGTDYAAVWTEAPTPGVHSPGGSFTGTFSIQEVSGRSGSSDIQWKVYISADAALDVNDIKSDEGVAEPLDANGSVSPSYSGSWPSGQGSYYYLLVDISAADDDNPINDRTSPAMSERVAVPESFSESESNDGLPPLPASYNQLSVSQIGGGRLIRVTGTTDATIGVYDTFRFTAGQGANKLDATANWTSGTDEIDLHFWEDGGAAVSSTATVSDSEPDGADAPWRNLGLRTDDIYYIAVESKSTATVSYSLLLHITQ